TMRQRRQHRAAALSAGPPRLRALTPCAGPVVIRLMDPRIARHVYAQLEQADLVLDPFPHFYATNVFPDSFYAELLRNLPPDSDYKQFPPPYEERHVIELTRESVRE